MRGNVVYSSLASHYASHTKSWGDLSLSHRTLYSKAQRCSNNTFILLIMNGDFSSSGFLFFYTTD